MFIPKNSAFKDYNLNFHRIIDIHSKHDNMYKNVMFYALICINNHIITCIDCMLSRILNMNCTLLFEMGVPHYL